MTWKFFTENILTLTRNQLSRRNIHLLVIKLTYLYHKEGHQKSIMIHLVFWRWRNSSGNEVFWFVVCFPMVICFGVFCLDTVLKYPGWNFEQLLFRADSSSPTRIKNINTAWRTLESFSTSALTLLLSVVIYYESKQLASIHFVDFCWFAGSVFLFPLKKFLAYVFQRPISIL